MTAKKAAAKAPAKAGGKGSKKPAPAALDTISIEDGPEQPMNLFQTVPSDSVRVDISRWMPEKAIWMWHGRISLEDATADFLQEKFGGGRYQLKSQKRDDQGKWKWWKFVSLEIPGPYIPPADLPSLSKKAAAPDSGAAVVGTVPSGPGQYRELREMMEATMVTKMIDLMKPQPSQLTPIIVPLLGFLGPIILQLMTSRGPAVPVEVTLALAEMKHQLEKGNQAAPGGIRETMETISLVTEMQEMLKGGAPPKTSEGAPDMFGRMTEIVKLMMDRSQQVPQLAPGQPAAQTTQQQGEQVVFLEWEVMLREQAGMLINAARRNMDPQSAADAVITFLPTDREGAMMEMLQVEDPQVAIIAVIPEMAGYQKWLGEVLTNLKAHFIGEASEGDPTDDDGK